jgi:hypothetical protein
MQDIYILPLISPTTSICDHLYGISCLNELCVLNQICPDSAHSLVIPLAIASLAPSRTPLTICKESCFDEFPESPPLTSLSAAALNDTEPVELRLCTVSKLSTYRCGAVGQILMPPLVRPYSRDGFEIAIICALPIERDAVEALLDEEYEKDGFSYGRRQWIRMHIPQEDSATSMLCWRTCLAWV